MRKMLKCKKVGRFISKLVETQRREAEMAEVKVFIASSGDESEERMALEKLISKINDVTRIFKVTVVPEMWELKSIEMRSGLEPKQSEYNDALVASDIAFFLFGKRVGKYTREEFEQACNQVKSKKDLKVFVYFKNVSVGDMKTMDHKTLESADDIVKLKDFIKKLEQVYGDYSDIAVLQSLVMKDILSVVIPKIVNEVNDDAPHLDTTISKLVGLYNQTDKLYQVDTRDAVIADAIDSLVFLAKYNFAPKLDQDSFYELCHKILESTRKGDSINALSLMLKCEWDDSKDEQAFWHDNESAVNRQVKLKRIFIVTKKEAHRLKTNPQVKKHISLQERSSFINSSVVERDILESQYPDLLLQAGNGFILVDSRNDKIALLDEIPESGRRAKPITDEDHLKSLLSTFNAMWDLSTPLKEYLDNIPWSHYKKEMISIFVTTECNLNCDYCFTNKNIGEHRSQTIPLKFVKKGIDDYFATDYIRHVRFFGAGEPTVKFDLLKDIHKYAVGKGGSSVTFEIQTNGSFPDPVAYWLKENVHIIWISCDGTKDIQDKHRPFKRDSTRKSSEVIEKNIRILQSPGTKTFVGIRATITLENITHQKEMIDYFSSLGITDIWVDPIFPSVGDTPTEENTFDTMLFAEEFFVATQYARAKGIFYGSILTCNFNDSVNRHCRACLPVPHLTTDGFVSACDMALFGRDDNHMKKELIYGEWDEESNTIDYDPKVIKRLQSRTTENMRHCELCASKDHCGGYCLGEVLNETGDLFGQKEGVCKAIQYLDSKLTPDLRKYKYTHP